jgi:hypothetical protein
VRKRESLTGRGNREGERERKREGCCEKERGRMCERDVGKREKLTRKEKREER